MTVTCVLGGKPHQSAAGSLICAGHFDELGQWLIDVEREVAALDARPSMAVRWDQSGHGSLAFERAPVRVNIVVHTDRRHVADEDVDHPAGFDLTGALSAFETLHRHAQRVRDEHSLVLPVVDWVDRIPAPVPALGPLCRTPCGHTSCQAMAWWRTGPARLTVHTERELLSKQLDWAAGQPWIEELYFEIRTLREQLQAANGTSDPKPLQGRCPRLDDGVCGGRLWAVAPTHSTGTFITTETDAVHAVQCERNHNHRWEGRDLIRLSLILEEKKA